MAQNLSGKSQQIEIHHNIGLSRPPHLIQADRHDIDIPQLSLLTSYPGTKLYRRAKEKGLILHGNWDKYDLPHVVMKPERKNGEAMTPEQLEERYTELIRKVYSRPDMFLRSLKSAKRNTKYNYNPRTWKARFLSVMALNIIYRSLAFIGRE